MPRIDEEAKHLWSAAFFFRRAPHRDQATAIRILRNLTNSKFCAIAGRANSLLRKIDNEQCSSHD